MRILTRAHPIKTKTAPITSLRDLPLGFDNALYLSANHDVADAGITNAGSHYLHYGQYELRHMLPRGQGLDHPEGRMLNGVARSDWLAALAELCQTTSLRDVVMSHPRVGWLRSGFTLGSYLTECQDVAAVLDDPLQGAFHFLEFGLEEARMGMPVMWDADYVHSQYGMQFDPENTTISSVLGTLLKHGQDPLEIALTEGQYWELLGFTGAVLADIFDHEYYHAKATQVGAAPASFSRIDCLSHFVGHGRKACLPISASFRFDPDFYSTVMDTSDLHEIVLASPAPTESLDPATLYLHWLTTGMRQNMSPNLEAWALRHFGLKVPHEVIVQLPIFGKAAGFPLDTSPRNLLDSLLQKPKPALAPLDLSSHTAAEFVVDLADKFTVSGDAKQAEWLYWHLLGLQPNHTRALCHLADLVQRDGRVEMALVLRKQVQIGADSGWNTLTLAEALLTTQRLEAAAHELNKLPAKALADVRIANKKRELAHKVFYSIWNSLNAYATAYGISRTQDHLRLALQACAGEFSSAERSGVVRHVALVGNDDLYQCKLYRVDQKADQLRVAGYEVTIISPNHNLDQFRQSLDLYDAVIFFRVPAFPPMIETMIAAAQNGLLTFYEIDDVVFDTTHFPPHLESYAGQIDAKHHTEMACGVPLFEHAMSLCDYGIASTATIAKLMQDRVRKGQVFEHHNALGRLHMTTIRENLHLRRADNTPLVIFYGSGTKAHKEDFHDVLEPALAEIVRLYPGKVKIHLIGYFGEFTHLDPKNDPLTFIEPMWDFEEYCTHVARADINLSVLKETLLTNAKSEIKWMEAAMFGIPSVVSATATHCEVIEDGKTGFLCKNTDDFINALARLVENADLRDRVGTAAQKTVMDNYALEPMGRNLRTMFETLRPTIEPDKTRLMVVNVFYPPQAIGGATRVVHDNITDIFAKYGDRYEIDVVCTLEGGQNPFEVTTYAEGGVRVHAITAPPLSDGDMTSSSPEMGQVFESLVERLKPDLIHFHCIQRLTASIVDVARHRIIPYVITLHDSWWTSPNQFVIDNKDKSDIYDYEKCLESGFPNRARALYRPLKAATYLLAVSDSFADLQRSAGLTNVIAVENGVSPMPLVSHRRSETGKVRLAHIGGASRHKGFHLVRNALLANTYDNLELLLIDHSMPVGSSRYEIWGTTQVTIMGKVPQTEIYNLYSNIDILLAPSIWPESYGLVTREAMACGVWVIASDRGAIGADIIEDETGHCVDVSNYAGLADCLCRIDEAPDRYLEPPAKRPELRSALNQVDDLMKIYDRILKSSAV